jgi:hypothetical protein
MLRMKASRKGNRLMGAASNIPSTPAAKLPLFSCEAILNFYGPDDLAYDSGDFKETLTTIATGGKITAKGSYIIIFKRQPNGSWQIVQHVWTGVPPPSR